MRADTRNTQTERLVFFIIETDNVLKQILCELRLLYEPIGTGRIQYIYIYIYISVCVCVCVYTRTHIHTSNVESIQVIAKTILALSVQ